MAIIKNLILTDKISQSIPKKHKYVFRKEVFGAVIFNKLNLKQVYIDNDGFNLLEDIDGKKTVLEIFEEISKKSRIPKIILAIKSLVYLNWLKSEEFIELETDIPDFPSYSSNIPPLCCAPNQISWLITNQCNLHCSHCGNTSRVRLENELSTKECMNFIDDCSQNKVFVLNISGGEPFLRRDLFQIVNYARKKDIEVAITTNATKINEKNIVKIKKIDCFNIHLSLDGIGKEHDDFRNQKGLFKHIQKTVKLLKKHNIPFGITTSITKRNFSQLEPIKKFILSNKIGSWEIYYAIPVGCLKMQDSLSDKEFLLLAKKIEKLRKELKGKADVYVGDSMGYYGNCNLRDYQWVGCLAGVNHCAIDAEGNIKGCPIQSDAFIEGNIRKNTLSELWNKKGAFKYNREKRELEGYCKKCKFSKKCRAGCITSMDAQGNKKFSENKLCIRRIENSMRKKQT